MKKTIIRSLGALFFMLTLSMCISISSRAAQSPRLNLKKIDLTKSTTFRIRVYNLGEGETATFKSTDSDTMKVVKVADNKRSCVISGKSVGKATLKVSIKKSGKTIDTLKCKVNVTPIPVSIKFSEGKVELFEGKQAYIDAIIKPYSATEQPVFESSDEDVATVNANGLVTAESPGRCTITATLLSTGKKAKCTIIVKKDPNDD